MLSLSGKIEPDKLLRHKDDAGEERSQPCLKTHGDKTKFGSAKYLKCCQSSVM